MKATDSVCKAVLAGRRDESLTWAALKESTGLSLATLRRAYARGVELEAAAHPPEVLAVGPRAAAAAGDALAPAEDDAESDDSASAQPEEVAVGPHLAGMDEAADDDGVSLGEADGVEILTTFDAAPGEATAFARQFGGGDDTDDELEEEEEPEGEPYSIPFAGPQPRPQRPPLTDAEAQELMAEISGRATASPPELEPTPLLPPSRTRPPPPPPAWGPMQDEAAEREAQQRGDALTKISLVITRWPQLVPWLTTAVQRTKYLDGLGKLPTRDLLQLFAMLRARRDSQKSAVAIRDGVLSAARGVEWGLGHPRVRPFVNVHPEGFADALARCDPELLELAEEWAADHHGAARRLASTEVRAAMLFARVLGEVSSRNAATIREGAASRLRAPVDPAAAARHAAL